MPARNRRSQVGRNRELPENRLKTRRRQLHTKRASTSEGTIDLKCGYRSRTQAMSARSLCLQPEHLSNRRAVEERAVARIELDLNSKVRSTFRHVQRTTSTSSPDSRTKVNRSRTILPRRTLMRWQTHSRGGHRSKPNRKNERNSLTTCPAENRLLRCTCE